MVDGPVPEGVDVTRPSAARIYDYWLGGEANFEVDRESAAKILDAHPDVMTIARENRAFLGRAVRYVAGHGVRQFIDLGAGVPAQGPVHEVARQVHDDARIVYVDIDPIATAHAEALVGSDEGIAVVEADIREPGRILADPRVRRLIDFDEPFALAAVSVLHFVADSDDPAAVLAAFTDLMVPYGFLLMSHATAGNLGHLVDDRVKAAYKQSPANVNVRTPEQIRAFFAGFELTDPGDLTNVRDWDPGTGAPLADSSPQLLAAVGRKLPVP